MKDLTDVLIGYSHPHCSRRFKLLDLIEYKLTQAANNTQKQLDLADSVHVLYEITKQRVGSRMLVRALNLQIGRGVDQAVRREKEAEKEGEKKEEQG